MDDVRKRGNGVELIIVLCDSFDQAEFEFGIFLEFLNSHYEPITYINDAALIIQTDNNLRFKFMGRRWLRFLTNLDMEHTEILELQQFVEDLYLEDDVSCYMSTYMGYNIFKDD